MRVIFMGTPEFGVPVLESILSSKHQVVAVVCQPDRQGNKCKLTKPPVKVCAECNNIDILQFDKVSKQGVDKLRSYNADIMVTAAFGQILSHELLSLTPYGVINVHASLLPYYRGSAPIHYAILNGEKRTGITIMQTALSVDSGDILLQDSIPILPNETTGELTVKLSALGASLIVQALDKIEDCTIIRTPQDHSIATHYPMLKKNDGKINYNLNPKQFVDFVRGMNPWPSAYTTIGNNIVKINKACVDNSVHNGEVGEVIESDPKKGLIIMVNGGCIQILEMQPEGKKNMSARDYLSGRPIAKGTILC